jgi:hypothetical protein
MGMPKGPSEGGSGGRRGHSGMEHWGFTDEVKMVARRRRRLNDKLEVRKQREELAEPQQKSKPPSQN